MPERMGARRDSRTSENPPADVPAGVRCSRCGYDVRLLPVSGRCPECGASIAESFRQCDGRRRWGISNCALLALFLGCAVGLVWRVWTIHSYHLGHSEYELVCFVASVCYGYLCVRARRSTLNGKKKERVYAAVLIFLLLCLWSILMNAWYFERLLRQVGILGDGTSWSGGGLGGNHEPTAAHGRGLRKAGGDGRQGMAAR